MIASSQTALPARHKVWRDFVLIFIIALIARAGFGIVRLQRSADPAALEFPDEHQYWFMAKSMANGQGLRDEMGFRATRMPLYPAFLSPLANVQNSVVIAKAAHWIIGALAAPGLLAIALAFTERRVALLAGLLVALDPFLIFFSSLLLTETFAITALILLWFCLARTIIQTERNKFARWLGIGVMAALCVYLRESNLGLVVVAILFTMAMRKYERRAVLGGALALLCVLLSLVPWAARNRAVIGEWCWLTTRAGISLYDGVRPEATGASDLGSVQRAGVAADLSETQWNEHFQRQAWAAIRQDPARITQLAGRKLVRMWNPFPNVDTYRSRSIRLVSAMWTVPLFVLAIVGAVRLIFQHGRSGWAVVLFLLLPAIYFSLVHSLYIGSVRYRLPAMPMIALLAAMAFSARDGHDKEGSNERRLANHS